MNCNSAKSLFLLSLALLLCRNGYATERSATVTLVSDYLFNGVTQTDENPALQGSIDIATDNGFWFGSWASNVDFGDDTDLELDLYAGYYQELENGVWYDIGLLYYSYHGGDLSDELNYAEVSAAFGTDNWEIKFWYTPDYAGTDAAHIISALSYSYPYSDKTNFTFLIDRSQSLDEDKFAWQPADDNYIHWRAGVETSVNALDLSFALEATDLDTDDELKFVISLGKSFSF